MFGANLIKRIIFPHSYSETAYISFLRKKGVEIGKECKIWSPNQTHIDTTRPTTLHIGNYVKIARNVTILCHDYSRSVLAMYGHENIGEARKTWIGDNVFIGVNATILMGTYIGNNSIVGAGAVVSGIFPDGSVIAGNPAKVIMTIDEYLDKRKSNVVAEAVYYVKSFQKKNGKYPTVEELGNAFSWIYLPHKQETIDMYPSYFKLSGIDNKQFKQDFLNSNPIFNSYNDFIQYVNNISYKL